MRKIHYVFMLVAFMGLCLNGCMSSAGSSHGVLQSKQVDDSDPKVMVIYGNEDLQDKVRVVRKMLDDTGRLSKCSLTVQNISDKTLVLEYQFQWLEEGGVPIMQTAAWSRLTLSPYSLKPLVNMGKMPEAKVVEFTVRFPQTELYQRPVEKK